MRLRLWRKAQQVSISFDREVDWSTWLLGIEIDSETDYQGRFSDVALFLGPVWLNWTIRVSR